MHACLLVVLFALVCAGGCASEPEPDGPLWTDPGILRLSPEHTHAQVEIHNRSGTPRPISGIALRGPNWDSLRFVDETHPRTIAAYGSVRIELEVSAASFQVEPGRYDSGSATLIFASNRHAYELPIEFVGSGPAPIRPLLLGLLVLVALAVSFAWGPLRAPPPRARPPTARAGGSALAARGETPHDTSLGLSAQGFVAETGSTPGTAAFRLRALDENPGARSRDGFHHGLLGSARALTATTFAALLMAAAAIPVGFGACRGRLGALVGPRELETCREMIVIPSVPAIWWWIASLTIAGVTLTLLRARTQPQTAGPELALVGLRMLGITLILATLQLGLAPADGSPTQLIRVQAQMTELAGIGLPRWGLIAQPLGAALAFALVASTGPRASSTDPTIAALERLELLVWVAVLATAFLGGPALPWFSQRPIPLLTHGPTIALELSIFVLELALIGALVLRLREHLAKLELRPAQLIAMHSRWTIPLALLQLVAVLLW